MMSAHVLVVEVNITLDGEGVEGGPMGAEHLLLAAQTLSTPAPSPDRKEVEGGRDPIQHIKGRWSYPRFYAVSGTPVLFLPCAA